MTHRSKHSESYKPTEADTLLAHASDESISYDQNQFFAQVPRILARLITTFLSPTWTIMEPCSFSELCDTVRFLWLNVFATGNAHLSETNLIWKELDSSEKFRATVNSYVQWSETRQFWKAKTNTNVT
jgi:hypothetical protein